MARATKKNILVVEDDTFLARALASKLKKEGFDVAVLRDGEKVLETVKADTPDMLLLDLMMPRKDGFAVLKELRTDAALKKLPVIVLSNLSQEPDTDTTKDLDVLDHLVKADTPLSLIVNRIKQHLQ